MTRTHGRSWRASTTCETSPAETGIRGNSHMIMQDKNNLQVADLILKWIDERVSKPKAEK